jgi:type II secretory ATPase GspE/PulE/Tfp pilus assembly ATPase PilB-like protein
MQDQILAAVQYGGYISIVKFVLFVAIFFLWFWLVTWIHNDSEHIDINQQLWTLVVFAAGGAALLIWLLIPLFIVGMALCLIAVAGSSLAYISSRNTKVMEPERILTQDHIKSLLGGKGEKLDAKKGITFVTANNNDVPLPEPRTPDFFGYKTAHELFIDAIWKRASDIAFLPTQQEYRVSYQIDGAAIQQPSIPRDKLEYFSRFLKNVSDLDPNEKRKPQKGAFKIHQGRDSLDWEVTCAGSTAGEQILIKRLMHTGLTRLSEIGLLPDQFDQLSQYSQCKQGLFLVTGTPKSGATTTFYSLLRNHDAFINSINTLERNISLEVPNVIQESYSLSDTGTTTFFNKLQTLFRMGPDIVGVAGCQDTETARLICEAANNGTIVYLTLAANSVIDAAEKWIKLVGDKKMAVQSLLGISNQRLLRTLCEECKQPYTPNKELLKKFGIPTEKAKILYRAGKVIYNKHGKESICNACQGTGFIGRTGVFEILSINDQLRNALAKVESSAEIRSLFRGAKMLYLQEQALRKIITGSSSVNEMVRILSKTQSQSKRKQTN